MGCRIGDAFPPLASLGTINRVMVAALDSTQSCSVTAGAGWVGFQNSSTRILEFGAEAGCEYLSGPRTLCPNMLLHPHLKSSTPFRKIPDHTDLFLLHSENTWPARCSGHLPGHRLKALPVVPFTTTVLFDHFFVEGFVGTSSTRQSIPQGQRLYLPVALRTQAFQF